MPSYSFSVGKISIKQGVTLIKEVLPLHDISIRYEVITTRELGPDGIPLHEFKEEERTTITFSFASGELDTSLMTDEYYDLVFETSGGKGIAVTLANCKLTGYELTTAQTEFARVTITFTKRDSITSGVGDAIVVQKVKFTRATAENDACSGGTALKDSEEGGYEASKAFDDSDGTYWQTTLVSGSQSGAAYIGYDFGVGVTKDITNISINQYDADSAINSIKVQYSDNNVDWNDAHTATITKDTGEQEIAFATKGSHRYWRILANAETGVNKWSVKEVELFDEYIYMGDSAYIVTTYTGNVQPLIIPTALGVLVRSTQSLGGGQFSIRVRGYVKKDTRLEIEQYLINLYQQLTTNTGTLTIEYGATSYTIDNCYFESGSPDAHNKDHTSFELSFVKSAF
jgi:hypothetical protein